MKLIKNLIISVFTVYLMFLTGLIMKPSNEVVEQVQEKPYEVIWLEPEKPKQKTIKAVYSPFDIMDNEAIVPKVQYETKLNAKPHYKIGAPYTINGKTYTPKYEPNYNKVGLASWYGPGFHKKLTANGDIFDMTQMTAASPTLPLYSVVTVTNLENGRKIKVVVNDRGPYHADRILDLSNAAAVKLDILNQGVAKVQVVYNHKETVALLKEKGLYSQYLKKTSVQVASN